MKQIASKKYLLVMITGIVLLVAGLVLLKSFPGAEGVWQVLPYAALGVGAGMLGNGAAGLLQARIFRKDPEAAKRMAIETQDERNVAINNKAKSKAFDLMNMSMAFALIGFSLMGVEWYAILLLLVAYLIPVILQFYYVFKYSKEM